MKRHEIILQKIAKQKHIEVLELCEALEVSAVTIRKDLKLLEKKDCFTERMVVLLWKTPI